MRGVQAATGPLSGLPAPFALPPQMSGPPGPFEPPPHNHVGRKAVDYAFKAFGRDMLLDAQLGDVFDLIEFLEDARPSASFSAASASSSIDGLG